MSLCLSIQFHVPWLELKGLVFDSRPRSSYALIIGTLKGGKGEGG